VPERSASAIRPSLRLTEGIAIAAAPLFGYLATLAYEIGFADSFGVGHG
jgi:hypothetical protein